MQAVQSNAYSTHVKLHVRMKNRARRIIRMHKTGLKARLMNDGHRLGKAVYLQRKIPVVEQICRRKMRKRTRTFKTAVKINGASQLKGFFSPHANTGHSAVNGQVVLADFTRGRRRLAKAKRKIYLIDRRH